MPSSVKQDFDTHSYPSFISQCEKILHQKSVKIKAFEGFHEVVNPKASRRTHVFFSGDLKGGMYVSYVSTKKITDETLSFQEPTYLFHHLIPNISTLIQVFNKALALSNEHREKGAYSVEKNIVIIYSKKEHKDPLSLLRYQEVFQAPISLLAELPQDSIPAIGHG